MGSEQRAQRLKRPMGDYNPLICHTASRGQSIIACCRCHR